MLEEQRPQGIMILPLWPTQVWWPELVKMLRKCSLAFLQLGNLFQRLGLESSLLKDWPTSTPMPFLSFIYNTLKMSTEVS